MYDSGSHLSATNNEIKSSEWDHTALRLAESHGNTLNGNKLYLHTYVGLNKHCIEALVVCSNLHMYVAMYVSFRIDEHLLSP